MLWFFAVAAAIGAALWGAVRIEQGLGPVPVGDSGPGSAGEAPPCRARRRPPAGRCRQGCRGLPGGRLPRMPHCNARSAVASRCGCLRLISAGEARAGSGTRSARSPAYPVSAESGQPTAASRCGGCRDSQLPTARRRQRRAVGVARPRRMMAAKLHVVEGSAVGHRPANAEVRTIRALSQSIRGWKRGCRAANLEVTNRCWSVRPCSRPAQS